MTQEPVTIAYIMSRFPKLTETFVLYEILELQRLGFRIVVLPLRREPERVRHPEIEHLDHAVFPASLLAPRTWGINLKWLLRHPVRYIGTLLRVAKETIGNRTFFIGALLYFPKAVCFAESATRAGVRHIHAHFATHPTTAAWCVNQLCGIPYSFTAHGSDLHVDQCMLATKARHAAFAVTISRYNKAFIETRCGADVADRFLVIHTGTDLTRFAPQQVPDETEHPLRILCIASFREVKGHDVLLRACDRLRRQGVPFHCTLVGYGPLERKIRSCIQSLQLEAHVTIAGPQPRPAVIEMLAHSDVIALTSIQTSNGNREGIPVALMEGMACGLPVVASRISGIPELVEHGRSGLLFTPGNATEAAEAFAELAASRQKRVQYGMEARQAIAASFDLTKNAAILADRIRQATT